MLNVSTAIIAAIDTILKKLRKNDKNYNKEELTVGHGTSHHCHYNIHLSKTAALSCAKRCQDIVLKSTE